MDVAIIECGIGGTYDHTNIIRSPTLTAITSQGIDHRSLLGHTIEENSGHKAGIMKSGVECFVASDQHEVAMIVFKDRAERVGAKGIFEAPKLEEYDWGKFPEGVLGLKGRLLVQFFEVGSLKKQGNSLVAHCYFILSGERAYLGMQ